MKKLLFLLACTTFVWSTQAEAKSVKLGRTTQISADQKATVAQGDIKTASCNVGYYRDSKTCKACSSSPTLGIGCAECTSATVCTKCKKGYDMYNGKCMKPTVPCKNGTYSLNADNGPYYIGSECKNIDVYGANASYYTPDDKTDYYTVNVRYWNSATVGSAKANNTTGGITAKTLKSTYNTSWNIEDLKNSVITFNEPVTVNGTVILQEALNDFGGVTMKFPQGLSGNPNCVVDKQVPSSGCGYASCSTPVDTNTTCKCTTSECKIEEPAPTVATGCDGKTFSWNSDSAVTVPAGSPTYNCVDGYGATSSITMPATTNYHRVNVRFWNGATVKNAINAGEIASRDHTSYRAADLNTAIHFKGKVKTNKVVLQEATNSTSGNRKGITMFFDAGLEALTSGGTVTCEVVKLKDAPGTCQWASCNQVVETDAICSCNNAKCEITDPTPAIPTSCTNRFYKNTDSAITVPSGHDCVDVYGHNSPTITMPSGKPAYAEVNVRMWGGTTVKNEFTVGTLQSLYHTSWNAADLNATITFSNKVTANKIVLQEATNSTAGARKGIKMVFNGGLEGEKQCVVRKLMESSGCGYASCSAQIETSATCTCSGNTCQINNDSATSCQSGYAWREKRTGTGAWAAGCYPIGTCATSRPDLVSGNTKPTCMFINAATGKGQCKTDNVWTSTECTK